LDKSWPKPKNDLELFGSESIEKSKELIVPEDYMDTEIDKQETNCKGNESTSTSEADSHVSHIQKHRTRHNLRQTRFRVPKN
jgi:hypothetical protein